jgi:prepilin-type N-terminal cleavage/methylation domain-containing protein
MKRFKAFTLIEMLVTLTLFSMSMIIIYNLLSTTLGVMNNISGGDESRTSAILFAKLLENNLRNAYNIYEDEESTFVIEGFDNRTFVFTARDKICYFSEIKDDKIFDTKTFTIKTAESIDFEILETQRRKALEINIKFKGVGDIKKTIILGFKKSEES